MTAQQISSKEATEKLAVEFEDHARKIAESIRQGITESLMLTVRHQSALGFEVITLGKVDPLIHIGMARLAEQQLMDEILR